MATSLERKTTLLLAGLWERNRPLMLERLAVLDRAAGANAAGALPEALREDAIDVAHKFAGSLGMFGFHRGTDLARELEQSLRDRTLTGSRFQALVQELRRVIFPEPEGRRD